MQEFFHGPVKIKAIFFIMEAVPWFGVVPNYPIDIQRLSSQK